MKKKIKSIIKITRVTTKVLINARNEMLKSSFNTAKDLATVYKDAGIEAFKLGRAVLRETVEYSRENSKHLFQTSENAFKRTKKIIKSGGRIGDRDKRDLSIDDLL